MVDYGFKVIECKVNITCISEDELVKEYESISDELSDGFNEVIDAIIVDRNNVIAYEIAEMNISSDGADKQS